MVYPFNKPFFSVHFLDTLGEGDTLFEICQMSCDDLDQVLAEIEPLGVAVTDAEAAILLRFNDEELTLPSTTDPTKAVIIRAVGLPDTDFG